MGIVFSSTHYSNSDTDRSGVLDRRNQILLVVIGFIAFALAGFCAGIAFGVATSPSYSPPPHHSTWSS